MNKISLYNKIRLILTIVLLASAGYWLSTAPRLWQIIFIAVNLAAIFFYGLDKLLAILNRSRISEKFLLTLALIGGAAGSTIAQYIFRHKTIKTSFQNKFLPLAILNIAVLILLALKLIPAP